MPILVFYFKFNLIVYLKKSLKIPNLKSKDRQHNSQKKKDKRTNNNLQNITQRKYR